MGEGVVNYDIFYMGWKEINMFEASIHEFLMLHDLLLL